MGGADKGLVTLAGRPMLAHVIEHFARNARSSRSAPTAIRRASLRFGLPVFADDPPDFSGPLAGVLAGLDFCARAPGMAHLATVPADAPFAPKDFVARLHEARRASGAVIAVAASGGRVHHVAAVWPVALAAELRRALADEGLRKVESFAERFSVAVVDWPCEPADPFFNVNTSEDLARAEALIRASSGGAL